MPDCDARCVLAVDIGSTRMHVGLVATGRRKPTCLFRADFPLSATEERLPKALGKLKISVPAVIAGGRRGHAKKVCDLLKKRGITSIAEIRRVSDLPVRFRYDRPETLGADRIADALYAAAMYPKRNAIIIDSGTAITVDTVNNRAEFIGGAIFAGIGTQLCALHAATSALPLLTILAGKIPVPGRSTEQCMRAGAAHGTAGALNYLVKKYKSLLGGNCVVLATGGAWHLSKKLVDFKFIEAPDMTLIGTALYALYKEH